MSWIDCVVDNDFEIFTEFPYQIRRKANKRIVAETFDKHNGYIRCRLNKKFYQKHRIIVQQFIPNDDRKNKTQIDHINHIKTDNRIENLRWTTPSQNNRNKSTYNGCDAEYFDEIDDDAIIVDSYNTHNFIDYYYVEKEDTFYFFNGIKYRKLKRCYGRDGYAHVNMRDINNKSIKVFYSSFKRQYDLI